MSPLLSDIFHELLSRSDDINGASVDIMTNRLYCNIRGHQNSHVKETGIVVQ